MDKYVGVGIGVMLLRDRKVLLGKRHPNPEKASSELEGAGTWTMPGGKLEFGETFEEGARRELKEETDILAHRLEVVSISNDMVQDAHFVTIGMVCREFSGEYKVMEPDEITEWRWFGLADLPNPLYFPTHRILKNYRNGVFYQKSS